MKKHTKKKKKIVISGYYGYKSTGDETVLSSILEGISERLSGSLVTVLYSKARPPKEFKRITVRYIKRTDPFAILHALFSADLFISGGGSLMQDITSKRSLSYYCALIHLAKLLRCRIFVLANGIGPLKNEKKCARALLSCDIISVRDSNSYELAQRLTRGRCDVRLTADPIFTYGFRDSFKARSKDLPQPGKYFAVSLRKCADKKCFDKDVVTSAILRMAEEGLSPLFVSMQDSFDLEISKELARVTGGTVITVKDCDELYSLLKDAAFCIGMRLHFLLTAAIAGAPLVALSYDNKVDSCIGALGIDTVVNAFELNLQELLDAVERSRTCFLGDGISQSLRRMHSLALCDRDTLSELFPIKDGDIEKRNESMEKFFADT